MKKKVLALFVQRETRDGRFLSELVCEFPGGIRIKHSDLLQWRTDTGFEIKEEPRVGRNGVVLTFGDEWEYKMFMMKYGGGR